MLRPVLPALGALLALAALAPAPQAFAQRATVNGYVRDADTGETLLLANVVLEGTGRGAATNTAGFYVLSGLEPSTYTLAVSYLGYETARDTLTLRPGETRRLDVELRPEAYEAGEVVVEAEEPIEEERAVGLQQVPIQLVERLPTVFEPDLFRAIQLLPGVKAASDFSSKLYIRGGSPDQTLILLDGTTVYNPTHFFGFFSTFNTEAIKDVRLYKGAYPATYGGRLGSVVDVYNRDGNRNRAAGMVQLGMLASRAGVEGPLRVGAARGSYMVAARRSTLEPLLAYLRESLDEDGIPDRFYFYDLNAKVGLDLSPKDRLSLSGYAGRDLVRVPFAESVFDLDYGNQTLSLAYTRILSESLFSSWRATGSRYASTPRGDVAGTTFEAPNRITDLSGRADLEWVPSSRFEAKAGLWGGHLTLDYERSFDGFTQVDFRAPSAYGSGYVEGRWRPWPSVIVTGGLRGDYYGAGNDFRLGPRLQVERTFGDVAVLQLAAGRYYQFLTLISNEAFSGFDIWLSTGEGVEPAESEQVAVGLKTKLPGGYRFDVEVYGRTMRGLFDLRPEVQDVAGLAYAELFRIGEGYAYGAEFLAEKQAGPVTGLVGYTWGVTRRRFPAARGFEAYYAPKYDRLHDVSVVVSAELGRGWSLTAAGSYATGQAYSEVVGRYSVGTLGFLSDGLNVLVARELNANRLPAYHRVDLGLKKGGRLAGVADYELLLQAVNVYNRRNVWYAAYDYDENPPARTEVRQLPILPNLSLQLRF